MTDASTVIDRPATVADPTIDPQASTPSAFAATDRRHLDGESDGRDHDDRDDYVYVPYGKVIKRHLASYPTHYGVLGLFLLAMVLVPTVGSVRPSSTPAATETVTPAATTPTPTPAASTSPVPTTVAPAPPTTAAFARPAPTPTTAPAPAPVATARPPAAPAPPPPPPPAASPTTTTPPPAAEPEPTPDEQPEDGPLPIDLPVG